MVPLYLPPFSCSLLCSAPTAIPTLERPTTPTSYHDFHEHNALRSSYSRQFMQHRLYECILAEEVALLGLAQTNGDLLAAVEVEACTKR